MPGAATPPNLLEAIASAAGGGFITNPIPEDPTGTNAASIRGGYPPITMQPEFAGGEPPLGQDINGYLFLLSSHTLWVECGQLYQYNATLATAIGGYLVGTILGMADGTGTWLNTTDANTSNPDTGGVGWVPIASYGSTTIATTGGTVFLTAAQSKYGVIILTGILTQNLVVNFPQRIQEWLVINRTTGAFVTTLKTAAGGSLGVTSPQGGFGSPLGIYSVADGNIYPTVAPLGVPIDQNPTPLTLVERTNAGYVLATYFNTDSSIETGFAISALAVFNTPGDGFIRKMSLTDVEAQFLLQDIGGAITDPQIPSSAVTQFAALLFNNAALTGSPTAPTAAVGTSNTIIATTQFANPSTISNSNGIAIEFPSGYILQVGFCNPNGGTIVANLPRTFPTNFFGVVAGGPAHPTQHNATPASPNTVSVSNTGGTSYYFAFGN